MLQVKIASSWHRMMIVLALGNCHICQSFVGKRAVKTRAMSTERCVRWILVNFGIFVVQVAAAVLMVCCAVDMKPRGLHTFRE